MARTKVVCPVAAYARSVVAGETLAGPCVRQACERHLRDLETGHERGLRFDEEAARHVIEFFPGFLRLAEGQFAGQPFELQPWQQFIVGSLFGWKGPDGYRRYRKGYVECAKGQGKTPLAAALGLYGLVADGEAGAEIFSAAVNRDQAGILFTDARRMVQASPELTRVVEVNVHNLAVLGTNSFFRPVSSEARSLDGKRVHMAFIDELHEHPDGMVVEKMQAGTKGRRQPLILCITNAGYDRNSVCWQHHDYSTKVLDGSVPDDGWFSFIAGLDETDDWRDPASWVKANPNVGVSVTLKYLEEQVREAEGMPAKENIVKRLNFCIWTESTQRWLSAERWDACGGAVDPAALRGRHCYGGLDLSSTTDLTAFVLVFPGEAGSDVLAYFWVPEEGVEQRSRKDRVPYPLWVDQGFVRPTPGNVVDYDLIRADITRLAEIYEIREIAIDRWNSTQLQTQLAGDGLTIIPTGQGFASMSAPTKELEKLVMGAELRHGGNPVLRWNAANVVVEQDAAGNLKPSKAKSTERIDGIVSLIMAVDRATRHGATPRSVYEERGLLLI